MPNSRADVFAVRDRAEMRGVNALSIAANVVYFEPFWYRSPKVHV